MKIPGTKSFCVLLFVGCALEAPTPPGPAVSSPLYVDCGTLEPTLTVTCNDGDPPRNLSESDLSSRAVPEGADGISRELTMACELGLDPGRAPIARVRATCEVQADKPVVTARLSLEGHAERRCGHGPQGSQGEVRPIWRAHLVPPPSRTLTAIVSVQATSSVRCELRLGDAAPRRIEPRLVTLLPIRLQEPMPLVIDCSGSVGQEGLAIAGCYGWVDGTPASPTASTQRVVVDVALRSVD